jgi:hypothetical protein
MLGLFGKKKLKEKDVAKIVVGTINDVAINGFDDIQDFIQSDPNLSKSVLFNKANIEWFVYIIFSANLKNLEEYFSKDQLDRLRIHMIDEFTQCLEGSDEELVLDQVKNYEDFISGIKNPSGELSRLIAKAIFLKFELNDCQQDHFAKLNEPNPLVIKEMNELTTFFIWNWEDFLSKYKLIN